MKESLWPEFISCFASTVNEQLQKINKVYGLSEKNLYCSLIFDPKKDLLILCIPHGDRISKELAHKITGKPKVVAKRVLPVLNEVLSGISTL